MPAPSSVTAARRRSRSRAGLRRPHIEAMVKAGIPVMGHIGLTPQAIHQIGKVRVQGKTRERHGRCSPTRWRSRRQAPSPSCWSWCPSSWPRPSPSACTSRPSASAPAPAAPARSRSSPTSSASATSCRGTRGPMRTCARPSWRRARLGRGRDGRHLPGCGRVGPHGRRGPGRGAGTGRARPARDSGPSSGIPAAASRSTATSRGVTQVLRTRAELRSALAGRRGRSASCPRWAGCTTATAR